MNKLTQILDYLRHRGWRTKKISVPDSIFPVAQCSAPDEYGMSYKFNIAEKVNPNTNEKTIHVTLPRKGTFADRCEIAVLVDLVEACGVGVQHARDPVNPTLSVE